LSCPQLAAPFTKGKSQKNGYNRKTETICTPKGLFWQKIAKMRGFFPAVHRAKNASSY
jgi:hypothetical protein